MRNVQEEQDVIEATPVQVAYAQEDTEPGLGRGRPQRGRGRPRSQRGKKPSPASGKPPRGATNSNGEPMLRPRAQPRGGRKKGRRSGGTRTRPTKGTLGISNEVVVVGRRGKEVAKTALHDWVETPEDEGEASSSGRSFHYDDDDVMAPVDDFGETSKLVGRGEFSLHSDDEYEEEEEDMDTKMNVDDEDEDYINEDSDGGREQPAEMISMDAAAAARRRFPFEDPDLTSSSSSDFQ